MKASPAAKQDNLLDELNSEQTLELIEALLHISEKEHHATDARSQNAVAEYRESWCFQNKKNHVWPSTI